MTNFLQAMFVDCLMRDSETSTSVNSQCLLARISDAPYLPALPTFEKSISRARAVVGRCARAIVAMLIQNHEDTRSQGRKCCDRSTRSIDFMSLITVFWANRIEPSLPVLGIPNAEHCKAAPRRTDAQLHLQKLDEESDIQI